MLYYIPAEKEMQMQKQKPGKKNESVEKQ